MIRRLWKSLAAAPLMLAFGLALSIPAMAAPSGHLDWADAHTIAGWAWDTQTPDQKTEVLIEISAAGSETPVKSMTVTAETYRADLLSEENDGFHGFYCPVDWTALSGDTFTVTACVRSGDQKIPLIGTIVYHTSADGPVMAVTSAAAAPEPAAQPAAQTDNGPSVTLPSGGDTTETPAGTGTPMASATKGSPSADPKAPFGPLASISSKNQKKSTSSSGWKQGESLGIFTTTGYCNCEICSSGWGLTYSGTVPQANHTISADINVLPLGTKVMINGIVYTVEDIGSSVNGNLIDIYYDNHADAVAHGKQTAEVFAVVAE